MYIHYTYITFPLRTLASVSSSESDKKTKKKQFKGEKISPPETWDTSAATALVASFLGSLSYGLELLRIKKKVRGIIKIMQSA